MADLEALIRVRKYDVEQRQKFLAELYAQEQNLLEQKQSMLDRLVEEEGNIDGTDIDMLVYFSNYKASVHERVEEIDEAVATLQNRIQIARDAVAQAFEELKKIEITHEARLSEERAAIDKKESNTLDEIALDIHRRNQGEE